MSDDLSADQPAGETPVPERRPFEKKGIFDKKLSDRPERFEDFPAWQEARRLATRFYEVTDQPAFERDAAVKNDIRRLAVEVMTQLASAVESHGERGFAFGLGHAKSAAAGLRSLLFVAVDRGYLTEQEQTELGGRAASLARSIGSQIFRLKRAETSDFKSKPGGFGGGKPGGFGPKKPYGGSSGGPKKPYGSGPGGPKKPYRPKRDD